MKKELKLVEDDEVIVEREVYYRLLKDSHFLEALEAAGVDNWEGISFAYEIYRENFPQENENG